jgi:opacity protein-like surface antigen
MAEFAYAGTKSANKYSGNSATSSRKYTYTSVPISFSFLFITPVSKNFSAYLGLGVGHYSVKIEEDWIHQSPWLGTESGTEVDKFKEFAPHILFGIETTASKRMIFFGEIRQSVGKTKLRRMSMDSTSESDEHFGGQEIKVGIRFYLPK